MSASIYLICTNAARGSTYTLFYPLYIEASLCYETIHCYCRNNYANYYILLIRYIDCKTSTFHMY